VIRVFGKIPYFFRWQLSEILQKAQR